MGIKQKLILGIILNIFIIGVLGLIGYFGLREIDERVHRLADDSLPSIFKIHDLTNNFIQSSKDGFSYITTGLIAAKGDYYERANKFNGSLDELRQLAKTYPAENLQDALGLIDEISARWKNFNQVAEELFFELENNPAFSSSHSKVISFSDQAQLMMPLLEEFMTMEKDEVEKAHDSADRMTERLNMLIVLIFSVGIIISFIINWLIIVTIIKPLRFLEEGAINFGKGDLDKRVKVFRNDELGTLAVTFNLMAENITKTQIGLEKTVAERTVELEKERGSLEKKVRERTVELEKAKLELEKAKSGLEKTVTERTAELQHNIVELKKINSIMIDRELKMMDLKKKLKEIRSK